MANLQYTSDIKNNILKRGGEPIDGRSSYDDQILDWINRAYSTLAMGGGEFNEDIHEDWWWLRKDPPSVLVLQPPYEAGTVIVNNNSDAITLSLPPTFSLVGWCFRVTSTDTVFRISAHLAGSPTATLDSVYTNTTGAALSYMLFKTTYDIASDVMRLSSMMQGFSDSTFRIDGIETDAMNRDWPESITDKGIPTRFCQVTESKVRFNKCGTTDGGKLLRVEYNYLMQPPMLVNALNEEPLVPLRYRQILADMALMELHLIKDDNRDVKAAERAKRGIRAMSLEHRHRITAYSATFGKILPRQGRLQRRIPRTASGFYLW